MSAIALVLALAIEQWRLAPQTWWQRHIDPVVDELPARLDGGRDWHAWLGWWLSAVGAATLVAITGWLLGELAGVLEGVFIVAVLYFTLGFRVFSKRFGEVRDALAARRLDLAGAALADWQGAPLAAGGGAMPATTPETIARLAIERNVAEAGRWLFGGVFWFALLPGAAGAMLYRASDRLALRWGQPVVQVPHSRFAALAAQMIVWLDAIPARLAASAFALVGNFTGATEGWQSAVRERPGDPRGLMVAAALGALGMTAGVGSGTAGVAGTSARVSTGSVVGASFEDAAVSPAVAPPVAAPVSAAVSAADGTGGAGRHDPYDPYDPYDGAAWDADSYALAVVSMDGASALIWRSALVWLAGLVLLAVVV